MDLTIFLVEKNWVAGIIHPARFSSFSYWILLIFQHDGCHPLVNRTGMSPGEARLSIKALTSLYLNKACSPQVLSIESMCGKREMHLSVTGSYVLGTPVEEFCGEHISTHPGSHVLYSLLVSTKAVCIRYRLNWKVFYVYKLIIHICGKVNMRIYTINIYT